MTVSAKIFVRGRVQGVGFRAFALDEARILELSGYCRNLPDGRVEVFADGEKRHIAALIEKLRTGPRMAEVEEVKVAWGEGNKEAVPFVIRYE